MKKSIIVIVVIALFAGACKKEGVYDKAEGTWVIDNTNLLGGDVPGDGSSISFEFCDAPPCKGSDYKASDQSTGEFTYEFTDNDQTLVIVDTMAAGGNYNFSFDILSFSKTSMRVTTDAGIFGNMTMDMSKQ